MADPVNDLVAFFNTPLLQGAANAAQLTSLGLGVTTLSNTDLLIEINRLFQIQNHEKLDSQFSVLVKSILQNEQILKRQDIIIKQNEEIISLLKGGIR